MRIFRRERGNIMEWDYHEGFYRRWERFHKIWAGVFVLLLGLNAVNVATCVHNHRPIGVILAMIGVSLCVHRLYKTPDDIRDVRRRRDAMHRMVDESNALLATLKAAAEEGHPGQESPDGTA